MTTKKAILILFVFLAGRGFAQQDPQFTQWMFDKISFNPAFAGAEKLHTLQAFHRTQWAGFGGDPKTFLFNYNGYAPVGEQLIGFGLSTISEQLGQEQNNMFRASFAYHQSVGAMKLSFGFQLGALNKRLGTQWVYIDQNDPLLNPADQNSLYYGQSSTAFDASYGLSFYKPNRFYFGISGTHLPASNLEDLNYKMARHTYIVGGFDQPLNANMVLRTNLMLKSDWNAKPAYDLNANVLFKNMLWGGLSFRPGDALAPMVGFQKVFAEKVSGRTTFNQTFRMGYSYDVTTSDIRDYSAGSHEVFLSYGFSVSKEPLKTYHVNPRFLY